MKKGPLRYPHFPDITQSYCYIPFFKQLFARQPELGNPVKIQQIYPNVFFTDLAPVYYWFTYVSGYLSCGLNGGKGTQLNATQKQQYKVHLHNKRCTFKINPKKEPICTGYYRYIVSPKGGLYIFDAIDDSIFHNSIRASQPVQCAGTLYMDNGFITYINNASGHYRPTRAQLMRTLGGLYAAGFIDEATEVSSFHVKHLFSGSLKKEGDVGDLMSTNDIQIPEPWQATKFVHDKMKRRMC
ncbi:hypothetical protein [Candidatus Berkiella aquae]|uniref:Uncharacterized protein n=1 Tax=Candidatus Berkiella aquae TaxID=295108 RepID=A0A0Q9YQI3_9GAMM|nr:hypothetical protein [Candidatus Berkiella aquae]MCS5709939.1 hypothetical protein [Candidatus Berkiella aquae]